MDEPLNLIIITPEGALLETTASYVDVPLINGNYGILKNHAPMLGVVRKGKVRYDNNGEKKFINVNEGILHINDNIIELLV